MPLSFFDDFFEIKKIYLFKALTRWGKDSIIYQNKFVVGETRNIYSTSFGEEYMHIQWTGLIDERMRNMQETYIKPARRGVRRIRRLFCNRW